MENYITILINGLVASLPSIIAVISLIVNNNRAAARNRKDRLIKYKLDAIESIYAEFEHISDEYIEIVSSTETTLYDIQEEIVFSGTENKKIIYISKLSDLQKRAILLAKNKNMILKELNISMDTDGMALSIMKSLNKLKSYASVISHITKQYIVNYYEFADYKKATEAIIKVLEEEKASLINDHEMIADSLNETLIVNVNDYYKKIDGFDNDEKTKISECVKTVVKALVQDVHENFNASFLDDYDKQVSKIIKSLLK